MFRSQKLSDGHYKGSDVLVLSTLGSMFSSCLSFEGRRGSRSDTRLRSTVEDTWRKIERIREQRKIEYAHQERYRAGRKGGTWDMQIRVRTRKERKQVSSTLLGPIAMTSRCALPTWLWVRAACCHFPLKIRCCILREFTTSHCPCIRALSTARESVHGVASLVYLVCDTGSACRTRDNLAGRHLELSSVQVRLASPLCKPLAIPHSSSLVISPQVEQSMVLLWSTR